MQLILLSLKILNKPLKIAIFCRDIEKLADWEYRLFDEIIDSKYIIIKKIYQKKNFSKQISLNDLIFKIFIRVESLYTNLPTIDIKIKKKVINYLKKIPLEKIKVKSHKYFDYFDTKISLDIKNENYDLILRHDFNIIKGKVLNSAKYGIWSFHHGDTSKYKGGPSGFWEIINREPVTGVTLMRLNNYLDKGDIINKSFYSTKRNFLLNNYFIMDKSFKILIKSMRILYFNNDIRPTKYKKSYSSKINKSPNIFNIIKYYIIFSIHKFIKIKNLILSLFFIKNNIWNIFFNDGEKINIEGNSNLLSIKNEFWADPFFFESKDNSYLFFERYNLDKKKGVISAGKIINNKILNVTDIVERNFHLSYPQVFNYRGKTLMTFESWQSNKCEILISQNFPYNWVNYSNFLKGVNAADPTFYEDEKKNLWLFINISKDLINDHDSELYIYLVRNNFKTFIPHKKNPVVTDARTARNAGSIFKYKDQIIRPSQINIHDIYGYGLNFQIIKNLSINEYEEVNYKKFFYNSVSKYNGIHHVSKSKKGFVFDRRHKYYLK